MSEFSLSAGFPGMTCLRCHASGMVMVAELIECVECGAVYPVLARVPVMFERVVVPANPQYAPAQTARDLLAAFHLPTDAMHVLQMRRLIAQRPIFGDALVRTEAAQFLDRVRSSGSSIAGMSEDTPALPYSYAAGVQARMYWLRDYIPRVIPPGHHFTANVRFRNTGAVPLRHAPPANISLAPRWLDNNGRPVQEAEDVRTPLPLDVQPGQELTLPVTIMTPIQEGRYRLRLILVEEGVGWLENDAVEIPISLRRMPWAETPQGWTFDPKMQLDYSADHARGLAIMRGWMADLDVQHARVLEIGGNAYPVVAEIEGELHNVDVDLLGLQIGCLVQDRIELERPGRRVHQLCADADELPFADGYFDAIVMFATLHHFPDPARTLAHVATKLRPGGFIGLFCEPVGHVHPGAVAADYLRELQRGVNEQSFLMREWADIVRSARLQAIEAIVEGGSLKARLVRAQGGTGAAGS
jgi:SAM-dependent methyltransferase